MVKIEEKINIENKRDYDKEPIVIEDISPQFMWLSFKYILFPCLLLVFIIIYLFYPDKSIDFYKLLIFVPISSFPAYFQFKNTKNKRKIFMYEKKICYKQENEIITEISLTKKIEFYKSFQNYYHKSQNRLKIWHLVLIFLIGLIITKSFLVNFIIFVSAFLFSFISYQIIKFIYTSKYYFANNLLIFNKSDFISIPVMNEKDYAEIEKYFIRENIYLNNFPYFYKFVYGYENINLIKDKNN